jgi:hypothetical protein
MYMDAQWFLQNVLVFHANSTWNRPKWSTAWVWWNWLYIVFLVLHKIYGWYWVNFTWNKPEAINSPCHQKLVSVIQCMHTQLCMRYYTACLGKLGVEQNLDDPFTRLLVTKGQHRWIGIFVMIYILVWGQPLQTLKLPMVCILTNRIH